MNAEEIIHAHEVYEDLKKHFRPIICDEICESMPIDMAEMNADVPGTYEDGYRTRNNRVWDMICNHAKQDKAS